MRSRPELKSDSQPTEPPSFGGLILNKTISKQQFQGMAIFTPIICGVGGNLVAIQTSRISTYLHVWSTPGVLPLWMKQYWPNPCSTFCTSDFGLSNEFTIIHKLNVYCGRPHPPTYAASELFWPCDGCVDPGNQSVTMVTGAPAFCGRGLLAAMEA
uniref:Solute carrier family 41 member n=1 Tax=Felis catus TaxID=9685 RepID=A0ABI7XFL2_FELCA